MSFLKKGYFKDLRSVVKDTGSLIEKKIEIENEIFHPSFGNIVPVFFKKTGFIRLVSKGNEVLAGIEKCLKKVAEIESHGTFEETKVAQELYIYLQIFQTVQEQLLHIAENLLNKTLGIKLDYRIYKSLCDDYHRINATFFQYVDIMNNVAIRLNFVTIKMYT